MPAININQLRQVIPRYQGQVIEPEVTLKYPDLAYLRLSASTLEIMGRNGYVQRFGVAWIPTYFGKHGAIFVCSTCRGGAIRLFGRYGSYACRFCHRAQYLSQNKRRLVASASQRASCGSSSAAGQTFTKSCRQGPNGRAAEPTSAFDIRSKPSKHKPSEHASAKKSIFAPSATTWLIQISVLTFGL
jgi:hypothetical protein